MSIPIFLNRSPLNCREWNVTVPLMFCCRLWTCLSSMHPLGWWATIDLQRVRVDHVTLVCHCILNVFRGAIQKRGVAKITPHYTCDLNDLMRGQQSWILDGYNIAVVFKCVNITGRSVVARHRVLPPLTCVWLGLNQSIHVNAHLTTCEPIELYKEIQLDCSIGI